MRRHESKSFLSNSCALHSSLQTTSYLITVHLSSDTLVNDNCVEISCRLVSSAIHVVYIAVQPHGCHVCRCFPHTGVAVSRKTWKVRPRIIMMS
jgi:hypothetical protein